MSSDELRKSLSIVTGAGIQETDIEEAAPMSFLKKLTTKAASLFDPTRIKELEVGQVANELQKTYISYLRETGKAQIHEGTIGDLLAFFASAGFSLDAVLRGMSKGLGVTFRTQQDLQKYANTRHRSKDKLANTFLSIVQFERQKPAATLDPDEWVKRSTQGGAFAAKVQQGALPTAPEAGTKAGKLAATKPAPSQSVPLDDIEAALKQLGA
jgi:hypothetical protein